MWKAKYLTLILLPFLFLVGCDAGKEKKTSSLRIDLQEGDLPSLHPHALMIYLRGISISKVLFESLTRIDASGKAQLAGAKSVRISPDRMRYTFVLRSNKWSDGSEVTAFQYENAWKEALSPTSDCSRADLLYLIKNAEKAKKGELPPDSIGVKATDKQTLVVELENPSPYFLELAAQPICAPLVDPQKKEPDLFNGPFQLDSWKRTDNLKLKPNPYFWNHQKVALNQIDISMIQDVSTVFSLYERKELDWIGVPLCALSSELIEHLKRLNALESHPVDRVFWYFLNVTHPALSSPLIRQALGHALDRQAITEHILVGGRPLAKPIPVGLLSSPEVKTNPEELHQQFQQGLDALGFTKETLPPIVITYSQQANRKKLAEYVQEVWTKTFGIRVQLLAQEWTVLRSNLEKGLFEACCASEAAFYNDPMELMERYASINPVNFTQWTYPPYTEIISAAKVERDPAKRTQLLIDAEKILIEQMPVIPICSDKFLFSHNPNLKGYTFDSVGAIDFSYASLN